MTVFAETKSVTKSRLHCIYLSYFLCRDSRGFEREAIREAEAGNIATSFALINQALDLTPERPSCYNNRAQIHRLNADVKSALEDLNQAYHPI